MALQMKHNSVGDDTAVREAIRVAMVSPQEPQHLQFLLDSELGAAVSNLRALYEKKHFIEVSYYNKFVKKENNCDIEL